MPICAACTVGSASCLHKLGNKHGNLLVPHVTIVQQVVQNQLKHARVHLPQIRATARAQPRVRAHDEGKHQILLSVPGRFCERERRWLHGPRHSAQRNAVQATPTFFTGIDPLSVHPGVYGVRGVVVCIKGEAVETELGHVHIHHLPLVSVQGMGRHGPIFSKVQQQDDLLCDLADHHPRTFAPSGAYSHVPFPHLLTQVPHPGQVQGDGSLYGFVALVVPDILPGGKHVELEFGGDPSEFNAAGRGLAKALQPFVRLILPGQESPVPCLYGELRGHAKATGCWVGWPDVPRDLQGTCGMVIRYALEVETILFGQVRAATVILTTWMHHAGDEAHAVLWNAFDKWDGGVKQTLCAVICLMLLAGGHSQVILQETRIGV